MNLKPVSTKGSSFADKGGRGCLIAFGFVFLAAGLGFLWMTLFQPILKSQSSGDWQEARCTITNSKVDVDNSGDGTTYRPKVEFEYTFDGQDYEADTYDFTSLNRSRARCKEIVNNNAVGTQTSCFVNPDDPNDAVIVRSYDFSWMGALFPLIFSGIGIAVILAGFFGGKSSKTISGSAKDPTRANPLGLAASARESLTGSGTQHPGDIEDQAWDEPQKLKPSHRRFTSFLLVLGAAIFWNVLVSIFMRHVFNGGMEGFNIVVGIFLIPFAIVGIGLIGGAIHQFGAIFNPKVELALTTGAVRRGDSVDVAWQLEGRTSKVRLLTIMVEGEESATYRRGTDTITAKNVFCTIPITEATEAEEIEFGSRTVTIPDDTMHTFAANRNKVTWRIVVHGDVPFWPNIKEEYEFRVKP